MANANNPYYALIEMEEEQKRKLQNIKKAEKNKKKKQRQKLRKKMNVDAGGAHDTFQNVNDGGDDGDVNTTSSGNDGVSNEPTSDHLTTQSSVETTNSNTVASNIVNVPPNTTFKQPQKKHTLKQPGYNSNYIPGDNRTIPGDTRPGQAPPKKKVNRLVNPNSAVLKPENQKLPTQQNPRQLNNQPQRNQSGEQPIVNNTQNRNPQNNQSPKLNTQNRNPQNNQNQQNRNPQNTRAPQKDSTISRSNDTVQRPNDNVQRDNLHRSNENIQRPNDNVPRPKETIKEKPVDRREEETLPEGYIPLNNQLTVDLIANLYNQVNILSTSLSQVHTSIGNMEKNNYQLLQLSQQLMNQNQIHAEQINKLGMAIQILKQQDNTGYISRTGGEYGGLPNNWQS